MKYNYLIYFLFIFFPCCNYNKDNTSSNPPKDGEQVADIVKEPNISPKKINTSLFVFLDSLSSSNNFMRGVITKKSVVKNRKEIVLNNSVENRMLLTNNINLSFYKKVENEICASFFKINDENCFSDDSSCYELRYDKIRLFNFNKHIFIDVPAYVKNCNGRFCQIVANYIIDAQSHKVFFFGFNEMMGKLYYGDFNSDGYFDCLIIKNAKYDLDFTKDELTQIGEDLYLGYKIYITSYKDDKWELLMDSQKKAYYIFLKLDDDIIVHKSFEIKNYNWLSKF